MTEFHATVRACGRITIPESTRKACGIKEGDIIKMKILEDVGVVG